MLSFSFISYLIRSCAFRRRRHHNRHTAPGKVIPGYAALREWQKFCCLSSLHSLLWDGLPQAAKICSGFSCEYLSCAVRAVCHRPLRGCAAGAPLRPCREYMPSCCSRCVPMILVSCIDVVYRNWCFSSSSLPRQMGESTPTKPRTQEISRPQRQRRRNSSHLTMRVHALSLAYGFLIRPTHLSDVLARWSSCPVCLPHFPRV